MKAGRGPPVGVKGEGGGGFLGQEKKLSPLRHEKKKSADGGGAPWSCRGRQKGERGSPIIVPAGKKNPPSPARESAQLQPSNPRALSPADAPEKGRGKDQCGKNSNLSSNELRCLHSEDHSILREKRSKVLELSGWVQKEKGGVPLTV